MKVVPTPASLPQTLPASESVAADRKLLLVDDDAVQLKVSRLQLAHLGYRVAIASNGLEAAQMALAEPFDAVIANVLIAGLDGFELCLRVRRQPALAQIPVLLFSQYPIDPADCQLAKEVGASLLIQRPASLEELATIIGQSLSEAIPPPPANDVQLLPGQHSMRTIRHLERQLTVNAAMAKRSSQQAAQLALLEEVAQALTHSADIETTLKEILVHCREAAGISKGALFLTEGSGPIRLRHAVGYAEADLSALEGLFGHHQLLAQAAAAQVTLRIPSPAVPKEIAQSLLSQAGLCTALIIPLTSGFHHFGALLVGTQEPEGSGRDPDAVAETIDSQIGQSIALTTAFARLATVALQNELLYREAEEAIQARDEFLSIASHELRTPLTALNLHVQGLLRILRGGSSGPISNLVGSKFEAIERQIARLTSLVNNLLSVSQISTRTLNLECEPLDLAVIVRDAAVRLGPEAVRAGCMLAVHSEGPVKGVWDRLRLDQVVTHLVGNALKYGAGKPVEISVRELGSMAQLTVCDHGIGIKPGDQARIFGRFERAVSQHHYGGLGLGLWIVRQILDALGGTVSVDSELGKGARFTVHLPRDRTSANPPSSS